MNLQSVGQRSNKVSVTFSISKDILEKFKNTMKEKKQKQSSTVEDLIKIYLENLQK